MADPIRLLRVVVLGAGLFADPVAAQDLSSRRVAGGFQLPVFVASPPGDARLFVVEQPGRIQIIESAASGSVLPTPFLDVSSLVAFEPSGFDERGLLGLAFAPDYASSRRFYVYYVAQGDPGVLTLATYQASAADSNQADPATARVLLTVPKPPQQPGRNLERYHNGGTIAFASDAWLYLGLGDGAGSGAGNDPGNCAQNGSSPLGKLLRIDVARVPQAGIAVPFASPCPGPIPVANVQDPEIEIWAMGLRNPYRFSFDRETGDLYVADVGREAREEIDVAPADALADAGPNYGWRAWEGMFCNTSLVPTDPLCATPAVVTFPVYDYPPGQGNFCAASVVGGYVHRGAIASIQGRYFFADYCLGWIRSLAWDGAGGIVGPVLDHTTALSPAMNGGSIEVVTGFGEGAAGELYVIDYGSFGLSDGEVFQVVPEPERGALALAGFGALALLARRTRRRGMPIRTARRDRAAWRLPSAPPWFT